MTKKTVLQKGILTVTGGNEKYYEFVIQKLLNSLHQYKYDEEGKIEGLIRMVHNKCLGTSLSKLGLDSGTLKKVIDYMNQHLGAFRIELLSLKNVKVELLDDNKFKKIRL
ncbi:hypothetical protein [Neobacillus cucumis]|uniref:hypothetical protein n=1 Tax=Neobacillus cucumis TaxID=1740721 RepID=UPI00285351CC|nr:hypothetical protein [Neobacillus cucumis]MDR4950425.1 hypothetical protein [Neobacillus cucumis]